MTSVPARASESPLPSSSPPLFANFDVVIKSWYVAAKSKSIKRGDARSLDWLNRRIVLWRDSQGMIYAMDARCPHLGADLGQGKVVGDQLRCSFHHWSFDGHGRCVHAPGREKAPRRYARTYPVVERYGLIWLFNGLTPTFHVPDFPDGDDETRFWMLYPPARRIFCHPHLVIGNGLDASHFETIHDMRFTDTPAFERTGEQELRLRIRGRPQSKFISLLTGTRNRDIRARFTTIGGNVAWCTVESPVRFHTLFSARPSSGDGCETQTVLFLLRGANLSAIRAIVLLYTLLRRDNSILNRLDFHPDFVESDGPLRDFAKIVNQMEHER